MDTILAHVDALLVTNSTNIRYLTGFVGSAPNEREAYVLLTRKQSFMFTNPLYLESAKNINPPAGGHISNIKYEIVEISREHPVSKRLAAIVKKLKGTSLGFEENNLTVAEYTKLRKVLEGIQLTPTRDRIEKLRMIKRNTEVRNIRKAATITDACFAFILGYLKPGVTETEIAWEIESYIRKNGAALAFSPIVAFNAHSSQPHYQGMGSGLKDPQGLTPNSLVLLDFGARVGGYCSDMTRVVFIGKPKNEWRRAYQTVLAAQMKALDYLNTTPKPSGATADRIARKVIKEAGFTPYPHSLGHAVGLAIHEVPRLTIRKDTNLLPGMVVTVEPAVYMEGQYGIRIEDLVCLTQAGIDILTKSTKQLLIL